MAVTDSQEVHDFYAWSRDYWNELSRSLKGNYSHALNFGLWQPETANLYEAQENFRRKIVDLLDEIPATYCGLEIGCGIGGFAVNLVKEKGIHLTCLDLLEDHLALTKLLTIQEGVDSMIRLQQGSSETIPFKDNSFDFAVCLESSFHYPDKKRFLQEVLRVLKSDCKFIIADITCEDNARVTFKSGNYFPSNAELKKYIEQTGFTVLSEISIGKNVFVPLQEFTKNFNMDRQGKLPKYWELVLGNYAKLSKLNLMDYQIFVLRK